MRGGGLFGEGGFFNIFVKENIDLVNNWNNFIILLTNTFNPVCDSVGPGCTDTHITKQEYDEALQNFLSKIKVVKDGKGTRFIKIDESDENAPANCNTSISNETKITEIINKFEKNFKSVLDEILPLIVKADKAQLLLDKSDKLRSMIRILSHLPDIEKNLPKIITNITNLNERYKAIVNLLKSECKTTFMGFVCGAAASAIGKDGKVRKLYDKLKAVDIDDQTVCNNILIDFIKDILPIMITNLEGIDEFTVARNELIEINRDLGLPAPATGGKKSSIATHKEILGKQMKIYRKPNDKKEYVKHKGVLISTKEYKEHMKQGAAITKKVILGKERCIYKVQGSKQDHVKYKGSLIPVADYKKLMKA
jgi:hypothetical protein